MEHMSEENRGLELSKIMYSPSIDSTPRTLGTKRAFTLYEKADLIRCRENEGLSVKQLTERFNCGKTAVYEILKRKSEVLEECRAGGGLKKRKAKTTGTEALNDSVQRWFMDTQCSGITVTGPMLQTHAKLIAESLGKTDFKASNRWLESFCNRHSIKLKQSSGGTTVDLPLLQIEPERIPESLEFAGVKQEPDDFVFENETEALDTSSSPILGRVDAESNSSSVVFANTLEKPVEHQTTTTIPEDPSLARISSNISTLSHNEPNKQCDSVVESIATERTICQRRLEMMEKEHEMRMEVLRIEKETAEINRDIAMKKRTRLIEDFASTSD